ncbi:MAG: lytic murein transglycosylase [Alphaproteobacteria bacterium]
MHYILLIAIFLCSSAGANDFESWRDEVKQEAAAQGISPEALTALDDIEVNPRVIELDRRQPEHAITFAEYRRNIMTDARLRRGRELAQQHADILNSIATSYGVPAKYLVALWGMESNYGSIQGNFSTLRSLLTLAYEGRRAAFFRGELFAALRIMDQDHLASLAMRGSWAGAMGQCQFMPSTFLRFAVDGDGDGQRDIWNNLSDVFNSMANYMRAEGWQPGMDWGRQVVALHAIAPQLVGLKQAQPMTVWQKLGIRDAEGGDLPADPLSMYYLVQPDGGAGPSYLVTQNYKIIMRWNRSTYFATTVGLLADLIETES